jgi:hypothetical protein
MKNNRKPFTRLLLLVTILTATFGAGLADVIFTDVIPIRPYTGVFRFAPIEMIGRSTIMGDILIVGLIAMLVASLLVAVANRTTGIVIAHSGGPAVNLNLTGSPGTASVIPLLPLIFGFLGLVLIVKRLTKEEAGI